MSDSSPPPNPSTNPPNVPPPPFRDRPVRQRTLWQSWAVLPAQTRLRVSLGLVVVAALGIFASDQLERVFPPDSEGVRRAEGASKDVPPP